MIKSIFIINFNFIPKLVSLEFDQKSIIFDFGTKLIDFYFDLDISQIDFDGKFIDFNFTPKSNNLDFVQKVLIRVEKSVEFGFWHNLRQF